MSEYFIFNGTDSRSFHALIFEETQYNASPRVYSKLAVPARSGQLLVDGKRYSDVQHKIPFIIHQDFVNSERNMRNFLLSQPGYKRLEDSRYPDEFFMAVYDSNYVTKVSRDKTIGKGTLTFTRKPQRYLKSGETKTTLNVNGSITNPTLFDSQPLLRIYGTGTVGIGDNAITITAADGYTDIDCEAMEAYKGTTSCNGAIQIQDIDFPVLKPGANAITLGTGITKVEITPRWYRL
jgi:predicted phage tail component-like protein